MAEIAAVVEFVVAVVASVADEGVVGAAVVVAGIAVAVGAGAAVVGVVAVGVPVVAVGAGTAVVGVVAVGAAVAFESVEAIEVSGLGVDLELSTVLVVAVVA